MNRNWNILQIGTEFHRVFKDTPMIASKRSKTPKEIIGGHTVKQGKAASTPNKKKSDHH